MEKISFKVGDVADIVYGEGSLSIEKKDRIYSVTISANDNGLGTRGLQQAFVQAFQKFNRLDAISYVWGGQSENMNAAMSQLSSALMIAIFLIYALIAAQFESFLLPFCSNRFHSFGFDWSFSWIVYSGTGNEHDDHDRNYSIGGNCCK
ncbi:AcrB/AcrD/AcrF family [Fusobacterium necrophorum subsp. necrophorum]|nr:AcrB/AcrD/AcrF family [Fusobacterium necrophorum subsp. necrophorum]